MNKTQNGMQTQTDFIMSPTVDVCFAGLVRPYWILCGCYAGSAGPDW